jgi:hypothetical protein
VEGVITAMLERQSYTNFATIGYAR